MSSSTRVLLSLAALASGLALGVRQDQAGSGFRPFSYVRAGRPLPPARPGERVLDLAAGTGTSSEPFADAGAVVVAAPLKIEDGSGSPLRVLALVPA